MGIEFIAIVLSIVSTIIALISTYLSQFKRGKVVVLPARAYKVEPLNFHIEGESYRAVRLSLNLTFMNSGAVPQAVSDLRVRIPMEKGKDLILRWAAECPSLDDSDRGVFASQPTFGPYESINRIYSFINRFEPASGKMVSEMEDACTKDENKIYSAIIEMRKSLKKWIPLNKIALHHSGTIFVEIDFEKINKI